MILTGDYHTHTPYSHGKNTVAENAQRAKEAGLKEIGISDHGFAHIAFGLRRRKLSAYRAECEEAEKQFGVKVLVGMEANILGGSGKTDLSKRDYEQFDIFLCGKHTFVAYENIGAIIRYGFGNLQTEKSRLHPSDKLIAYNTRAYLNAVKNNPLDAVTHLNYYCPADALEVAKCASDHGTYLELNAKKQHLTDDELSEIVAKTQVRFLIGSDAHSAERVGDTALVKEQLSRLQFPLERIDNIDGRTPNFRFREYKKGL